MHHTIHTLTNQTSFQPVILSHSEYYLLWTTTYGVERPKPLSFVVTTSGSCQFRVFHKAKIDVLITSPRFSTETLTEHTVAFDLADNDYGDVEVHLRTDTSAAVSAIAIGY